LTFKQLASKLRIMAHRGGFLCHENSLNCFKIAIEQHIHCIEFDVWLTKDYTPVVIHGSEEGEIEYENEATNVFRHSLISDLTLEQVKSITLPNNEKIPTLEEVLSLCRDRMNLNLEIKDKKIDICQIVLDLLGKYNFDKNSVVFSSFEHKVMDHMKTLDPSYKLGYLYEYYDQMDPDYYPKHGDSCNIPYNHLTLELVNNCKSRGQEVSIYFPSTVKEDPMYYRNIIELGVSSFISDKPLDAMRYIQQIISDEVEV
jgi:glycerophosphoryl diester phosphodiesterase